jgi:hypothetical protein
VRSLFRPSTLKNLIQELKKYKINIAAEQELRGKGNDIFDSDVYGIVVVVITAFLEQALWSTKN